MSPPDITEVSLPGDLQMVPEPPATDNGPAWKPLRMLTFYRLILAGLLTVLYFTISEDTSLSLTTPGVYGLTCIVYLLFSLAAGFAARLRWPDYLIQGVTQIFVDIGVITVLIHVSGGLASGLGILLVISVATGSVLFPGRMAFLFAAAATLAVMGEHVFSHMQRGIPASTGISQAGLLGIVLFGSAGLTYLLARRIRESEQLAQRRAVDIASLARLNAHIVQRLQAGIIATDHHHNTVLINDTARKLLNVPDMQTGQALSDISPTLFDKLLDWLRVPSGQPTLLKSDTHGTSILPHFTRLESPSGTGALIFLEDMAAMEKQAQQIKLASLGRLTASIAHEIRNPLGAISHAAQLLGEQDALAAEDRRLTAIIGDNSARVNVIVEDILQLSRPNSSIPQRLSLTDWTENFVTEFVLNGQIDGERISFSIMPADIEIYMDPRLLHQVVWNLCQNAVQHARTTQPVRLKLDGGLVTPDTAYLDIIDNGSGIDPDMSDKIFEPFFTTHTSGTGLGLYIAREICIASGAHLEFHPVADGGSCFRVSFPVDAVRDAEAIAGQKGA